MSEAKEQLAPDKYMCAVCHRVYTKGRTDEDAIQDAQQYWPGATPENCVRVCDECWQRLHPVKHPIEYRASVVLDRKKRKH